MFHQDTFFGQIKIIIMIPCIVEINTSFPYTLTCWNIKEWTITLVPQSHLTWVESHLVQVESYLAYKLDLTKWSFSPQIKLNIRKLKWLRVFQCSIWSPMVCILPPIKLSFSSLTLNFPKICGQKPIRYLYEPPIRYLTYGTFVLVDKDAH